jgi:hypothetical protein
MQLLILFSIFEILHLFAFAIILEQMSNVSSQESDWVLKQIRVFLLNSYLLVDIVKNK